MVKRSGHGLFQVKVPSHTKCKKGVKYTADGWWQQPERGRLAGRRKENRDGI